MPVSSTTYIWSAAYTYCTNSVATGGFNGTNGFYDWRLPTQLELSALYTAYPGNSSVLLGLGWTLNITWSSTPYSAGIHYDVYLHSGFVVADGDTISHYVTCVR
jgi:hypothetical protein